jgi:hypothetical protein
MAATGTIAGRPRRKNMELVHTGSAAIEAELAKQFNAWKAAKK